MKRFRLVILLLIPLASLNPAMAQKYQLLIGTYTNKGTSEGIYVYEFDTQTGKAVYKNKATGVKDPSFLTISNDQRFVYAVNESGAGAISAFTFNAESGALNFLNSKPSGGADPCYITVSNDGSLVFSGNYSGGNLSAFPLQPDGSLADAVQTIRHTGSSINKQRQEKPHVHSTVLSPDERYLLVSDLGTDKIYTYKITTRQKSRPLAPAKPAFVTVPQGSGPRHLDFHPNGKFAYSIQELTGNVTAFTYKKGRLTIIQHISMLAPGFKGDTGAADIHVSPDGKFLYTSNRGDANDIAVFQIDQTTGKLNITGRIPSGGKGPRNFAIDPTGNFLLAANQYTDNIVIFRRDQQTGLLTGTGERITVGAPVCLKFTASN